VRALDQSTQLGVKDGKTETYKFGWIQDGQCKYEYQNVFAVERTSGPERLVIAPSERHTNLMIDLLRVMPEMFWILYVLVVPRGGGGAGRDGINLQMLGRGMKSRNFSSGSAHFSKMMAGTTSG
jgi:hypothetical protein